jgi:hypothetical protein
MRRNPLGRIERLIAQAERLERRRAETPEQRAARATRIAELRKVMQREHPDKGGRAERFRVAKSELDQLRKTGMTRRRRG